LLFQFFSKQRRGVIDPAFEPAIATH
jgi:hypothetical protein